MGRLVLITLVVLGEIVCLRAAGDKYSVSYNPKSYASYRCPKNFKRLDLDYSNKNHWTLMRWGSGDDPECAIRNTRAACFSATGKRKTWVTFTKGYGEFHISKYDHFSDMSSDGGRSSSSRYSYHSPSSRYSRHSPSSRYSRHSSSSRYSRRGQTTADYSLFGAGKKKGSYQYSNITPPVHKKRGRYKRLAKKTKGKTKRNKKRRKGKRKGKHKKKESTKYPNSEYNSKKKGNYKYPGNSKGAYKKKKGSGNKHHRKRSGSGSKSSDSSHDRSSDSSGDSSRGRSHKHARSRFSSRTGHSSSQTHYPNSYSRKKSSSYGQLRSSSAYPMSARSSAQRSSRASASYSNSAVPMDFALRALYFKVRGATHIEINFHGAISKQISIRKGKELDPRKKTWLCIQFETFPVYREIQFTFKFDRNKKAKFWDLYLFSCCENLKDHVKIG